MRQMQRATRIFVRRQANWFKPDDPDIHWFHAGPDTLDEMIGVIREFLGVDLVQESNSGDCLN